MEVNVKFLRSTLLGIQHSIQRPGAHYRRVHPHQSLHICARTDLTRAFSRSGLWQMSLWQIRLSEDAGLVRIRSAAIEVKDVGLKILKSNSIK